MDSCSNHGARGRRRGDESTNTQRGKSSRPMESGVGGNLGKGGQRSGPGRKRWLTATEALREG